MKIPTTAEIIEQARERTLQQQEAEQLRIDEENKEQELGYCYNRMNAWRKLYFKIRYKKRCSFRVISQSFLIEGKWYYKFFLQLFRGGELVENFRIRAEAFDTLTRGREADHQSDGVFFYTIEVFEPVKKQQ